MVIRRFRERASNYNWFDATVELAIVVIGVFLGLQANNWNSARITANDASEHRTRLFEDVTNNQIDLASRTLYYQDARKHGLRALAQLRSGRNEEGEALLVDLYQASQINARTLRRSTYDELVAAGTLSQIGNADLRDLAETYYRGLKVLDDSNTQLPPYRERIRRELPYEVIEAIRTKCGDIVNESHGVVMFRLPSECHPDLTSEQVSDAVKQVRAADGLDRDLSRYLVEIDIRLGNFEGSERRAVKFKQQLAANRLHPTS